MHRRQSYATLAEAHNTQNQINDAIQEKIDNVLDDPKKIVH